jgi:hypothetical protein
VSPTAHLNGVIFKLPSADGLPEYDKRERFYCRRAILPSEIKLLAGGDAYLEDAQYWIYVTKPIFNAQPSEEYPIVQSYVDVSFCKVPSIVFLQFKTGFVLL